MQRETPRAATGFFLVSIFMHACLKSRRLPFLTHARNIRGNMAKYLSALRVLDLTDHRGLLAGHCLAHMGADVIQVEPPGGSHARTHAPLDRQGHSFFWEAYASGKRSVISDIHAPDGRALLLKLTKTADFLIESAPAGVMRKSGIGYEDLRKINPKLIYVSIKPFGASGPKADYADTDLILWAAGGALYGARDGDRPPVRMSVPQAYLHASADAAVGALVAHFARLQSGLGQHVEVAVQTSVAQATLSTVLAEAVGDYAFTLEPQSSDGNEPEKLDLSGSGSATSRRKFWTVKDGMVELHLAMGGATGKFTNNLFQWMKEEDACSADLAGWDWVKLPQEFIAGRLTPEDMNRARAQVGEFLGKYTRRELVEASVKRKILIAARSDIPDLADNPHYNARKVFQQGTETGAISRTRINWPARTSVQPPPPLAAAPRIGQHNAAIMDALHETAATAPASAAQNAALGVRPFAGLKVVDLSWVVAGPLVGRALAEYGATVVRVESSVRLDAARVLSPFKDDERGPDRSGCYQNCNAGKFGITLDLGQEAGRQIVRDLAKWADVIVESYSHGTMQKWGLSYEDLRAINPAIVMISSTLMGQTGPYASLAGFGNLGSAMAGTQAMVGWPGKPPIGPFGPYTDYIGPRFALITLLSVLHERRTTGLGCHIDVAQAECGLQFLAPVLIDYMETGHAAVANGNHDPGMAPHNCYPCKQDGERRSTWAAIAAQDELAWRRLAAAIGAPELAQDSRFATLRGRHAHAEALDSILSAWTLQHTPRQVEDLLQAQGIAAHVVSASRDFCEDRQIMARQHIKTLPHASLGETQVEGSRTALSDTPAEISRAAPVFGQDEVFVLKTILGYDDTSIARLRAAKTLS